MPFKRMLNYGRRITEKVFEKKPIFSGNVMFEHKGYSDIRIFKNGEIEITRNVEKNTIKNTFQWDQIPDYDKFNIRQSMLRQHTRPEDLPAFIKNDMDIRRHAFRKDTPKQLFSGILNLPSRGNVETVVYRNGTIEVKNNTLQGGRVNYNWTELPEYVKNSITRDLIGKGLVEGRWEIEQIIKREQKSNEAEKQSIEKFKANKEKQAQNEERKKIKKGQRKIMEIKERDAAARAEMEAEKKAKASAERDLMADLSTLKIKVDSTSRRLPERTALEKRETELLHELGSRGIFAMDLKPPNSRTIEFFAALGRKGKIEVVDTYPITRNPAARKIKILNIRNHLRKSGRLDEMIEDLKTWTQMFRSR
ncbi:MAG: hypothetical protein COV47_03575 [Candidatus Diapherotrites archaeon CG11_big_fil_rev_8_21_14_0_20_37_9]|nr:MAG: hypothetical protein COV47_03575 [Candidatus Diapherotrites archaeon CG11_big_fil_rev_8_21_14_0_20_37_9]